MLPHAEVAAAADLGTVEVVSVRANQLIYVDAPAGSAAAARLGKMIDPNPDRSGRVLVEVWTTAPRRRHIRESKTNRRIDNRREIRVSPDRVRSRR